jgi:hypothetical protein
VFVLEVRTIVKIQTEAWLFVFSLGSLYLFCWYLLWFGLDLLYARIAIASDLLALERLVANDYLQKKVRHLRSTPQQMLAEHRLAFEKPLNFAYSARYSLHGISFAGESTRWGKGLYEWWVEANKAIVAERGVSVHRIFLLSRTDIGHESFGQTLAAIKLNFFASTTDPYTDASSDSGIRCSWLPTELLPHLLEPGYHTPDITILDGFQEPHSEAMPRDTLLLRNLSGQPTDTVYQPMQSLEVIWDPHELSSALRTWGRLSLHARPLSKADLLHGGKTFFQSKVDAVVRWLPTSLDKALGELQR